MIEIFDKNYKKIAILENGFDVKEEINKNSMSYLEFSLPANDPKNKYCKSFNLVKYDNGQVYRIMPKAIEISDNDIATYECEHSIATLIDDVLFGFHVVGNIGYYTREVIEYILDKQLVKRWKLGDCEFNRQFEYGWEQENLLSALFSVPRPFTDDYILEYDTEEFPFTLHLRKIDMEQNPSINIRKQKNTLRINSQSDPKNICTRLYPLGYGEGVNQLNIKNINNGVPYIQSSPEVIAEYGIIQRIWTDRRYENEESLFNAAKAMLKKLEKVMVDYEVDFVDVDNFENAEVGKVARVIDIENGIDFTTLITSINIDYSNIKQSTISISETGQNIASSIADLADRQRIETTYSQGATNQIIIPFSDNADNNNPGVINLFIPNEMVRINKCILNVELEPFRAYSRAIGGGGGIVETTSEGGGSTATSSNGGGSTESSSSGGGGSTTSSSGGGYRDTTDSGGSQILTTGVGGVEVQQGWERTRESEGHTHQYWHVTAHKHRIDIPFHRHGVNIPDHTHNINIPSHYHTVRIPEHDHYVRIPGHKHVINLPNHTHDLLFGIFRGNIADNFRIRVDGKLIPGFFQQGKDVDLVDYLSVDGSGKITRGSWHKVEILPNKLTRIVANVFLQSFNNSRGGGDY